MNDEALILAAHGSTAEPATCALVRGHVQRIRRMNRFREVSAAYHQGTPGFAGVLDLLQSRRVTVVPLMTSSGYYSEVVLPRTLAASRRDAALELRQTPPVGTHPHMVTVLADRVMTLLRRFELSAEGTAVLLVGHGTRRHPRSRSATETLRDRLADHLAMAAVAVAFLDDDPAIADAHARLGAAHLIVLPFLIGMGPHARRDIPMQLGLPPQDDAAWPRVDRRGRHTIVCDRAAGHHGGIGRIILELARDAWQPPARPRRSRVLRLGARSSRMSRWQADRVAEDLRRQGWTLEIIEISTLGDRHTGTAIADLPGPAPFADDIEQALLSGDIDLAVHSLKDLATIQDPRLLLAAVLPRDDPGEALVARDGLTLAELPPGAVVGTSSIRRQAQLHVLRPDLRTTTLRGPVEARVSQVRDRTLDAAILAVAGLQRLGLAQEISERLPLAQFMPAPAQGALVVQIRAGDTALAQGCEPLNHAATRQAVTAELAFLRCFEHDGRYAIAAFAVAHDQVHLEGRLIAGPRVHAVTADHRDPLQAARQAVSRMRLEIGPNPEPG